MPKKHHHMTKHEYKAYQKTHRHNHASGSKEELIGQMGMLPTKSGKKEVIQLKKLYRTLRGHSSELLDEAGDDENNL